MMYSMYSFLYMLMYVDVQWYNVVVCLLKLTDVYSG
jgi:hypothetical protein